MHSFGERVTLVVSQSCQTLLVAPIFLNAELIHRREMKFVGKGLRRWLLLPVEQHSVRAANDQLPRPMTSGLAEWARRLAFRDGERRLLRNVFARQPLDKRRQHGRLGI